MHSDLSYDAWFQVWLHKIVEDHGCSRDFMKTPMWHIFDWHTAWLRFATFQTRPWCMWRRKICAPMQLSCRFDGHVSKSFNKCFTVTIGNVRHPLRQILDLRCRAFQRDHLKRLWMNCLGRYLVSNMQQQSHNGHGSIASELWKEARRSSSLRTMWDSSVCQDQNWVPHRVWIIENNQYGSCETVKLVAQHVLTIFDPFKLNNHGRRSTKNFMDSGHCCLPAWPFDSDTSTGSR